MRIKKFVGFFTCRYGIHFCIFFQVISKIREWKECVEHFSHVNAEAVVLLIRYELFGLRRDLSKINIG